VTQDRLTRREISWLLAQEARGAARALRSGLTQGGSQRPNEGPPLRSGQPEHVAILSSVADLDTLDSAIELLGALQTERGTRRRGRIDVAALLYAIVPQARIEIAPGEGTEVFGEEGELRRMLHVLLHQAVGEVALASATPEVRVERRENKVLISVDLGPDTSANAELERRWLARMALRLGGSVELSRGRQTIVLPADEPEDKTEVVLLRRELEEAQALGEAYAKELAAVLSAVEEHGEPPSSREELTTFAAADTTTALARATSRSVRDLLEALRAGRAAAEPQAGETVDEQATVGADFLADLSTLAELLPSEERSESHIVALARSAAEALAARAQRRGIFVTLEIPDELACRVAPDSLVALMKAMIAHGIAASPAGDTVVLTARRAGADLEVAVRDGGPQVPVASRIPLLLHRIDPAQVGRPPGVSLVAARTIATQLGGGVGLRMGESGRTELWARLPAT
jgi:signal transduction histidine kinase